MYQAIDDGVARPGAAGLRFLTSGSGRAYRRPTGRELTGDPWGWSMRTTIIGTAKGIFVVDAASGESSPALEGPSVRHLSRVNGHCVAGSTAGFFRSADAGRSWQPSGIGDREVWDVAAAAGDASTLYAVTEPAGLFLSRDGGASWTEIVPMEQRIAGMFRSDDHGKSWRFQWKGMTPPYTRPLCIDPRRPHAVTVGSSPTAFSAFKDEGGAKAMLFQSVDGGETWRSLGDAAHSPSAAQFHAVAPDPDTAGHVLAGTDTGELWRVSPEAHWTLVAKGLPQVQSILPVA